MRNKSISYPIFMMSLDVELLWGYIWHSQNIAVKFLSDDKSKGRVAVDTLLQLFEKYNISVTWAVVGHLFLDRYKKKMKYLTKTYQGLKKIDISLDPCTDIQKDPLYYGKDIIEKILSSWVKHEIGYHSFFHIVFSECSRKVAETEIKESIELVKEFGITLKSFVFPENKIGHIDVLKKNGFKIYRGRNLGRYDLSQNILIRKFNGVIDKIIAPPTEAKWMDGIWEISSSMFFCDPQIKFSLLPRAKLGLYRAIRSKKVFHIFLHPHNLLMYSSLKDDLDKFLGIVAKKRDEGKLQVMTMGDFASYLNRKMEEI